MAVRLLRRMFLPREGLFAFRLRRMEPGHRLEGVSRRYTAIVLIGLAGEDADTSRQVLPISPDSLCDRLVEDAATQDNLGDVSLSLWAAKTWRHQGLSRALDRVRSLDPCGRVHPTVELAWALTALSWDGGSALEKELSAAIAAKLMAAWDDRSYLFPHLPEGNRPRGLRGHVACFADQVYPIQALARYFQVAQDRRALEIANGCAGRICELQGEAGQWWWHYDVRTGRVIEGYPVYSVHQDAMAPMALFALAEAGGESFDWAIDRGMQWLMNPPEVKVPLVDAESDIIWRKVARHEPGKLTRGLQALASRAHPSFRVPGVAQLFPPGAVDYECRPYHLGWLLHAWSPERLARRRTHGSG